MGNPPFLSIIMPPFFCQNGAGGGGGTVSREVEKTNFCKFEGFLINNETRVAKMYDSYQTSKTKIRSKASSI